MPRLTWLIFFVSIAVFPTFGQTSGKRSEQKINKQQLAERVKAEFLHAWNGYKKYAWGHDDLKPLSKTYKDWYAEPILMTPVDSLDSLIILGFKEEADRTRNYIAENLRFDKDIDVQNFEITIRILGGLLGLSNDWR